MKPPHASKFIINHQELYQISLDEISNYYQVVKTASDTQTVEEHSSILEVFRIALLGIQNSTEDYYSQINL